MLRYLITALCLGTLLLLLGGCSKLGGKNAANPEGKFTGPGVTVELGKPPSMKGGKMPEPPATGGAPTTTTTPSTPGTQ